MKAVKPDRQHPIVPHVLVVSDRRHPYQLPAVEQVKVLYSTAKMVRILGATGKAGTKSASKVYCIPRDAQWIEFQEDYQKFQAALDAVANYLRSLGDYLNKLQAQGESAKNPLTPWVIPAPDPDYNHSPSWEAWEVPPKKAERYRDEKHTPQMLKLIDNSLQHYTTQANHFCCPNDAAYYEFCRLHGIAVAAQHTLFITLRKLGTYQEALSDGRYRGINPAVPSALESELDGSHLPPVANGSYVPCDASKLKPGDRVTFRQHWYGNLHQFEGTVQLLDNPVGTAVVAYDVPAHLDDGVERSNKLQAPIGTFALAKVPIGAVVPPECSLTQERDRLLQSDLAPQGAWLETCKVSVGFRQAYWRSRAPCLNEKKRRYIGKVDSPAHQKALEAVANRKRLVEVEKQLKLLEGL